MRASSWRIRVFAQRAYLLRTGAGMFTYSPPSTVGYQPPSIDIQNRHLRGCRRCHLETIIVLPRALTLNAMGTMPGHIISCRSGSENQITRRVMCKIVNSDFISGRERARMPSVCPLRRRACVRAWRGVASRRTRAARAPRVEIN